jgi:hypothetical protein
MPQVARTASVRTTGPNRSPRESQCRPSRSSFKSVIPKFFGATPACVSAERSPHIVGGGPSQTVHGELIITTRQVVFRPPIGMPHPQRLTLTVDRVVDPRVKAQRRMWVLAAPPSVCFDLSNVSEPVVMDVRDAQAVVDAIRRVHADPVPQQAPHTRLAQAIASGSTNRLAFADVIMGVSYPGGFWHAGSDDDLAEMLSYDVERLQLPITPAHQASIVRTVIHAENVRVDLVADEDKLRHDEILDLVTRIHETMDSGTPRRFHRFESDFPGWEIEDPFHLWLTVEEASVLVGLGIVTPFPTTDG